MDDNCESLKMPISLFSLTDTVNTASRMESNGLPNKIHVSEATATELVKFSKGDWLIEREGGVHAKGKNVTIYDASITKYFLDLTLPNACTGKGNMRTFWVNPQKTAGSCISGDTSLNYAPKPVPEPKSNSTTESSGDGKPVERDKLTPQYYAAQAEC
jgi:Adenylate and Guanylate cyclase catalytic domain